jgi:hypothetical protein
MDQHIDVKKMLTALQITMEFESKLDSKFKRDEHDTKFTRFISSCFDPYLDYYIDSEDQYS